VAADAGQRGAGCSPPLLLTFLFSIGKWRRLFWLRNRFVGATYARCYLALAESLLMQLGNGSGSV
jgi:hypothetical protein